MNRPVLLAAIAASAVCWATGCTNSATRPVEGTGPAIAPAPLVTATPSTTTAPSVTTVSLGTDTPTTAAASTTTTASSDTTAAPTDGSLLALDVLAFARVETEHRGGYLRELFGYPADFGHRCDTRAEVLRRDSLVPTDVTEPGCTVVSGEWRSPYDGATITLASDLEIDHVVALKEAWDSGAWAWSPAKRHAFANDIADPRTLRAVSIATNRDKGDKDPSNWLPPDDADRCSFVGDWVVIKVRWGLSMDPSEAGRLRNLLRGPCAGWRVPPFDPLPASLG